MALSPDELAALFNAQCQAQSRINRLASEQPQSAPESERAKPGRARRSRPTPVAPGDQSEIVVTPRVLKKNKIWEGRQVAGRVGIVKEQEVAELYSEMVGAGLTPPPSGDEWEYREWVKGRAERDLLFFVQWIVEGKAENRARFGRLHREMADFLIDFTRSRRKLLMVAVGHLKTTFGSHGLPLHVLIQEPSSNIYFPGEWGCDQRIVLANESEDKAAENLSVVATHLRENPWMRWLWPAICPALEGKPKHWTDFSILVPRRRVFAEPSVTAIGAETGFMGRHYTVAISDDLAGIRAGQSRQVMDRALRTQAALRTRLDDPWKSIEIEIGTHQSADDIYSRKKKDPTVEVMCRAIEEPIDRNDPLSEMAPIWPEKYPNALVAELRSSTDPILWALWYMNRPVPSGYTALNWEDLREFRFVEQNGVEYLVWQENAQMDRLILERAEKRNLNPVMRLMMGRPRPEGLFDIIRRQSHLGLGREDGEHLRMKYIRCEECGAVTEKAGRHDCPRKAAVDA